MRIQHNIAALNSYRNLTNNNSAVAKNLEKLSSGYRINRAGDDAAGLAISEKMRAQITGLNTAQKNANDGISLVQTAEGAMTEVHSMLNRMVELANQSANGTYADAPDRENLQKEIASLKDEINRIADSTNFNGINLLDGSLDAESTANLKDSSAISNITTTEFSPKGASAAFEASYITNRPEASTVQKNAEFTVKFDDVAMAASDATKGNNKFKVEIGDAIIEVDTNGTTGLTGADIAAAVAKNGLKAATGKALGTDFKAQTDNAAKVDGAETSKWDANVTTKAAAGGDTDCKYIKIEGHWYEMSNTVGSDTVTFKQVDYSENKDELITPDYNVKFTRTNGGAESGTTNWQVQNTKTGVPVGSSHQAQVSVAIDFSKLKDGDSLNVGDMTYVFKIGENSQTTAETGQTVIDLSTILKTESDLADTDKIKQAMVSITQQMGATVDDTTTVVANKNNTWSIGNGGVEGNVGTLTFQSLSSYTGDGSTAAAADKVNIGNNANNGICDMRTEASVMKQFFSGSKEAAASVSFDLDVTKLKEGDTIKIDGTTFEFTDGTHTTSKENIAVNLHDLGIAGGLLSSQTGDVMDALKTAINANLNYGSNASGTLNKYEISIDGSKMTLASNDNGTTANIYEQRTAAKIELGQSSYAGEALTLQIGDTSDEFNKMKVNVKDMHTKAMSIDDVDVSTQEGASAAVDKIKAAINYVSSTRGDLGAIQNRLEHTINNLSVAAENMTAAESRIRDVDMAQEMMAYTKNNILVQAAQAMLAQANQVPQGVLQLLQ